PPVARDTASDAQSRTAARTGADSGAVKRIMPTFFDTRLNRMSGMSYLPAEEAVTIEPPPPARSPVAARPPVADPPQLPRLPEVASDGFNNGGVEDAAAQLFRPIMKQWVTENMPKIVEKALRSESDDDFGGSSRYCRPRSTHTVERSTHAHSSED